MKVLPNFETLNILNPTAQRNISVDLKFQERRSENLKSCKKYVHPCCSIDQT
jgi:hypothetical protein